MSVINEDKIVRSRGNRKSMWETEVEMPNNWIIILFKISKISILWTQYKPNQKMMKSHDIYKYQILSHTVGL